MTTTDPKTGFTVRNSATNQEVRDAEAAARQAAAQPEPETAWGNVGQGAGRNEDDRGPFDAARMSDHRYFLEHKAEIFEAAARGELPGQLAPFDPTIN